MDEEKKDKPVRIKTTEIDGLKPATIAKMNKLNETFSASFDSIMGKAMESVRLPKINVPIVRSPILIADENEWERHKRLMNIQQEIVEGQNRILKEQVDTARLTRLILFLTCLAVALALAALYVGSANR